MRSITTNWDNSAYNNATTFVDKISGSAQVTFACGGETAICDVTVA